MTKAVKMVRGITGQVKNSNDEASVLNAGWNAMQQADPNLAGAVQRMPPEVARGVIFQYTNAIRSNQDDQASALATQYARDQLATFAQSNQNARSGSMVNNVNAFEQALANPTPFQQPQSSTASTSNPRSNMFTKAIKSFVVAKQPQAPKDPRAAFDNVRSQYQAFNQANWGDYEKNLLWDEPPERELTKPANWNPTGLIGSNMGTGKNMGTIRTNTSFGFNNPFGGN